MCILIECVYNIFCAYDVYLKLSV